MRIWIGILLLSSSVCSASEHLTLLISPDAIARRVQKISAKIDRDYQGEQITVVMVMKGALFLTSDLLRNLKTSNSLEYVQATSLVGRGSTPGKVRLKGIEQLDLEGKNILIIDDIFDTGNTMSTIILRLLEKKPKNIKSLVLFSKQIPRKITYRPEYVLFDSNEVMEKFPSDEEKDQFVVGYGIDYKERYRNLAGLYMLTESSKTKQ